MSKKQKKYTSSNEFEPEKEDKYWLELENKEIQKYNKSIPEVEYNITPKIIEKVKEIKDTLSYDNKNEYNICKYYKIYDTKDENNSHILCSRVPIEISISNDLINLNNNKNNSKLKNVSDISNVRYKLLEIYKVKKGLFFKKEFDEIKNRLETDNNITNIEKTVKQINKQNISIIDQYKNYISKNIDNTQQKHKYYIYKLTDQKNIKQIYIHGSYNKLKKRNIDELINNYCINFESTKIKSEIIKELEIYSDLEGLICVDEEIKNNDSIKNGLNKFYNIINDNVFKQEEIFMIIQQEKLNNIQKEKIESGYIASINITDKKYIFNGYNNTKYDKLNYFYHMIKHNEHEYDKIIELLQTIKLEDIKIEVLEKNIEKDNIEIKLIKYLNYYDKNILLNYNDKYYAKPEDIKKVNSLMFSMKHRR